MLRAWLSMRNLLSTQSTGVTDRLTDGQTDRQIAQPHFVQRHAMKTGRF